MDKELVPEENIPDWLQDIINRQTMTDLYGGITQSTDVGRLICEYKSLLVQLKQVVIEERERCAEIFQQCCVRYYAVGKHCGNCLICSAVAAIRRPPEGVSGG